MLYGDVGIGCHVLSAEELDFLEKFCIQKLPHLLPVKFSVTQQEQHSIDNFFYECWGVRKRFKLDEIGSIYDAHLACLAFERY